MQYEIKSRSISFSVVITTFNSSGSITQCINSVLKQSYMPHEILIVDDCSADYELLELKVLAYRQYIKVNLVKLPKKGNASKSRNVGAQLATSAYLAFLDADDEWQSDKLEQIYKSILIHGAGLYFTDLIYFRNGKHTCLSTPILQESQHISDYIFVRGGVVQTSAIVIDKSSFMRVLFDESLDRHQDYAFCLHAYKAGIAFNHVPIPAVVYHIEGRVFKSKNESAHFSKNWVDEHRFLLTTDAYWSYRLYSLGIRLLVERKYFNFIINLISCLHNLGFRGLVKSLSKFKIILLKLIYV